MLDGDIVFFRARIPGAVQHFRIELEVRQEMVPRGCVF